MRTLVFLLCLAPSIAGAVPPKIYTVVASTGVKFRHFELTLSAKNTVLPGSLKAARRRLDDTADNFRYGQFEIFIPARYLDLGMGCKSNYIVRMPMTLDRDKTAPIKEKQTLFYEIKRTVESGSGTVRVVIEILHEDGCNLFFRSSAERYVSYVGPLVR